MLQSSSLQAWLFQPGPTAWVQRVIGPGHTLPFQAIDQLATPWGVIFALGLTLWIWDRADTYALAGALVLEALANLGLNQLFSVPRPSAASVTVYEQVNLGSFPSGHVFTATVVWGLLWRRGRVPGWLAAVIVLAVGTARLYLGAHYLTDVIGGVVFGALLLWIFPKLWEPACTWLAARPFSFFVAAAAFGIAAVLIAVFTAFGSSRFLWSSAGAFIGAALALPIEYRTLARRPPPRSAAGDARAILLGLAGIVPLLLLDRASLAGNAAWQLAMALAFAGALWALLFTPWIGRAEAGAAAAARPSPYP